MNSHGVKRWINDIHPGLIAVYQALESRPEEFIEACQNILPSQCNEREVSTKGTGKKYNARLGEVFERLAFDIETDQALRYFFVNRTVWAGRVNYDIPSRMYYSNPAGWNIVTSGRLEEAAEHIRGTMITNGDYRVLLESPGKDVFIYCDAPYVVNTNLSRASQQYQYNFSMDDHRSFAEVARSCKHNMCISYDDSEVVRDLFDGFNFYTEKWKYSGSSLSKKKIGQELLITNY